MSLIRRLFFGQKEQGNPILRPKILKQMGPWILIEKGDGTEELMDLETFQYLYEESNLPDPKQLDIDKMLVSVRRVRVLVGGLFKGKPTGAEVLVDTKAPMELSKLKGDLRIEERPETFGRCGCPGGPVLELTSEDGTVEFVGMQHGKAIRWSRWKHDAKLQDGEALNRWLVDQGVRLDLLHFLFSHRIDQSSLTKGNNNPLSEAEQLFLMLEIRRSLGEDEDLLERCNQLLEEHPAAIYGYIVRATIMHERNAPAETIAACSDAIDRGFPHPHILNIRAKCLNSLQDSQKAIEDLTSALELAPRFVQALQGRAMIYAGLERYEECLKDLDLATQIAPDWLALYTFRMGINLIEGNHQAVIDDCARLIEFGKEPMYALDDSMVAMAHWNRAKAYSELGDEEKAKQDFERAKQLDPVIGMGPNESGFYDKGEPSSPMGKPIIFTKTDIN